MGLKNKNSKTKSSKTSKDKPKAIWRTAFTIKQSRDQDRMYGSADNYGGCLIWREYADGKNPGDEDNYYQVLSANVFEPKENDPDFVLNKLVINLNNEKSAVNLEE